jgi:large subunit ribosomal protein L31e
MVDEKIERLYTINLSKAYEHPRTKRTPRAVSILRDFIVKHLKRESSQVKISDALNKFLWKRSIQKPPRAVKVKVISDKDVVRVYLHDEKIEEVKKPETVKEEKKEESKESGTAREKEQKEEKKAEK